MRVTFLSNTNNNDDANSCYNKHFVQKLVYLIDIFENAQNKPNTESKW